MLGRWDDWPIDCRISVYPSWLKDHEMKLGKVFRPYIKSSLGYLAQVFYSERIEVAPISRTCLACMRPLRAELVFRCSTVGNFIYFCTNWWLFIQKFFLLSASIWKTLIRGNTHSNPLFLSASLSLQFTYSFLFLVWEKYFPCFPDDKQRSKTFSNFSCMFLNPNNFFQFEF